MLFSGKDRESMFSRRTLNSKIDYTQDKSRMTYYKTLNRAHVGQRRHLGGNFSGHDVKRNYELKCRTRVIIIYHWIENM